MSPIPPISSHNLCANLNCSKKATNICSRCRTVWYCTIECQKQDWKVHKPRCLQAKVHLPAAKLGDQVTDKIQQIMNEYIKPQPGNGTGLWYPETYAVYLDAKGKKMPKEFTNGHANTDYFTMGQDPFYFELKKGRKASEALAAFLQGPTICDCACATAATYFKVILDLIGPDQFDEVFHNMSINGEGISQAAHRKMYQGLFSFTKGAIRFAQKQAQKEDPYKDTEIMGKIGNRPIELGQECHFEGIKCYPNKHPEGSSSGFNVIYVGNNETGQQLFMAFGLPKPLTESEIYQYLIDAYNQERTELDLESIKDANRPQSHSREINPFMKDCYTVPPEHLRLFRQNPEAFLKIWTLQGHGFVPSSMRGIDLMKLAEMLKRQTKS